MAEIMELPAQHGFHVIEDAAQAFGATCKGRPAGSIGHLGCFSFFPSKNLRVLGDAGLLSTSDPVLAEKARILRVHGVEPKYYHQEVGANFRPDTLQAAFLRVKLAPYPTCTAARPASAARYHNTLQPVPSSFGEPLALPAPPKFILPSARPNCSHIWNHNTRSAFPVKAGATPSKPTSNRTASAEQSTTPSPSISSLLPIPPNPQRPPRCPPPRRGIA